MVRKSKFVSLGSSWFCEWWYWLIRTYWEGPNCFSCDLLNHDGDGFLWRMNAQIMENVEVNDIFLSMCPCSYILNDYQFTFQKWFLFWKAITFISMKIVVHSKRWYYLICFSYCKVWFPFIKSTLTQDMGCNHCSYKKDGKIKKVVIPAFRDWSISSGVHFD